MVFCWILSRLSDNEAWGSDTRVRWHQAWKYFRKSYYVDWWELLALSWSWPMMWWMSVFRVSMPSSGHLINHYVSSSIVTGGTGCCLSDNWSLMLLFLLHERPIQGADSRRRTTIHHEPQPKYCMEKAKTDGALRCGRWCAACLPISE